MEKIFDPMSDVPETSNVLGQLGAGIVGDAGNAK